MLVGLLTIITAVFIKQAIASIFVMLAYIIIGTIIIVIYSKKIYDEERRKDNNL
jgi:hypothetical protein